MKYLTIIFFAFPLFSSCQTIKEHPYLNQEPPEPKELIAQRDFLLGVVEDDSPSYRSYSREPFSDGLAWVVYKIEKHYEGQWIIETKMTDPVQHSMYWQSAKVTCENFEDWKVEQLLKEKRKNE